MYKDSQASVVHAQLRQLYSLHAIYVGDVTNKK